MVTLMDALSVKEKPPQRTLLNLLLLSLLLLRLSTQMKKLLPSYLTCLANIHLIPLRIGMSCTVR